MPKIQTARFFYSDENSTKLEYKADVNVGTEGIFSMRIPDFLVDFIRSERRDSREESKVSLHTRATGIYAHSLVLESLLNFVNICFRVYSAPDVQKELIIMYKLNGTASVWQDLDGTLRPDGSGAPDGQWSRFGGDWHSNNSPDGFGVAVAARVRLTKTRGVSVKTEYTEARDEIKKFYPELVSDADLPGAELNSFCCRLGDRVEQIPYTAEAERFFVNIMLSTAALARRIAEFGSDKERVLQAIASGSNFLTSDAVPGIEHKPAVTA
jgi:hypothetical protein